MLGASSGANGFTPTARPSTPASLFPRASREEAVGATREKVWGSVSGRPGSTGDPEPGPPFSERFFRFSGGSPTFSTGSYPEPAAVRPWQVGALSA